MALALTGLALIPGGAGALDSDLKHSYAFRVEASNGYEILALANSERADGRGEIVLFVTHGSDSAVIYQAPAQLSATRIDADLGSLASVALDVAPSGRKKKLRSGCGDEPEVIEYEPWSLGGSFEFRGEERFTEAFSAAPRDYTAFFARLVCPATAYGEGSGPGLPGARFRVRLPGRKLNLQVNKNQPGSGTGLEASLRERRGAIRIQRSVEIAAGAGAFDYDPLLRTATIAPPAPFSGHGTFQRDAAPANRWRGDLTVDFPGRSDVALTGGSPKVSLVHARLERG